MKAPESPRAPAPASAPAGLAQVRLTSAKIRDAHLDRLAIVYVRQSSPQQVLENRESTARQYAFQASLQTSASLLKLSLLDFI